MESNMEEENPVKIADTQINPLTLMTSMSPCLHIDDDQQNNFETIKSSESESDQYPTLSVDISLPSINRTNLHGVDDRNSSNIHRNNQAVNTWLGSMTTDSTLERSPSLPLTLIEGTGSSRRNSNVSTLCDTQQSYTTDTTCSQQALNLDAIHHTVSLPTFEQNIRDTDDSSNDDEKVILPLDQGESEEPPMQFLPIPESEDSEVDKKVKNEPIIENEMVMFDTRSPKMAGNQKNSPSGSFHASVSSESNRKLSKASRKQRRTSLQMARNKQPSFQRSQSYITPTAPQELSWQTRRERYRAIHSITGGHHDMSDHATRQSSLLSDGVFHSTSISHSTPSPRGHPNNFNNNHFLSIPSSGSIISSDRHPSIISDMSGRSGIESTNLDSSLSERIEAFNLHEQDKPEGKLKIFKQKSMSAQSSDTPSTEHLSTSSDDGDSMNGVSRRVKKIQINHNATKHSMDKRRDMAKQLMWLLEKKPSVYGKFSFNHRKLSVSSTKQKSIKSITTPVVEFSSNYNFNNNSPGESDRRLKSIPLMAANESTNSTRSPLNVVAINYVDPLSESCTSLRSTHSDPNTSSLNSTRKRGSHRRNQSSLANIPRNGQSLPIKFDSVTTYNKQDDEILLNRKIKNILNEHLTIVNKLIENQTYQPNISQSMYTLPMQNYILSRLRELSQTNPMNQRCSRIETKTFIDLITNFHMNCSHHYHFLTEHIENLLLSNKEPIYSLYRHAEFEDARIQDGHMASNESSNDSSPAITRNTSAEPNNETNSEHVSFSERPLRFFRRLSPDYILDCERTEKELQSLFDSADQKHILYCLKHVDSGHTNDLLATFHRRLDALQVWFNLYYELTISIKKLSGLLRCDDCDDWPKLHVRYLSTHRERKAKQAKQDDYYYYSTEEDSDEEVQDSADLRITEEYETVSETTDDDDVDDILPTTKWPEETSGPSYLGVSNEIIENDTSTKANRLNRTDCYRNFVYYMDKRSYQVKYDGLARTLIERVVPVLSKTRLALLRMNDRREMKVEQFLTGLSLSDFQSNYSKQSDNQNEFTNDDNENKLIDTDNPIVEDTIGTNYSKELTIEKWLHHVIKSCSTIKTICTHMEDISKQNWLELHQQLGLPSLLPLYFFIINVLLDVMNECLTLYNKTYMNNSMINIDPLCRQQFVREAKLILRDAVATRLYCVRMIEQFICHRKVMCELKEYDENIVKLYSHYKQFLSSVCIDRTSNSLNDKSINMTTELNSDIYYYVDEETSELIKEYYFARDLTVTLGGRTEIRDLCMHFSNLIQRILAQLKELLNGMNETFYQRFATEINEIPISLNDVVSAEVRSSSTRPPLIHTSASVPAGLSHRETISTEGSMSSYNEKKNNIISSIRPFRRDLDTIKQRAIRVCNLAKTLIDDFSIAAEFECNSLKQLWQELEKHSYTQVKIYSNTCDTDDFDDFSVFVPPWLSKEKDQVEKLLSVICTQQISDESNKTIEPSYAIFVPKGHTSLSNYKWTGNVLLCQPSESTKLVLNSTELHSLHLVANRFDTLKRSIEKFCSHIGLTNIKIIRKLPRDEDIRLTFEQMPEYIESFSIELNCLVSTLNKLWNQDSMKIHSKDPVRYEEFMIETNIVDLILYVYNCGFDLFRLLCNVMSTILLNNDRKVEQFVSQMNEFFCEWCRCVTRKYKQGLIKESSTAKTKVLKPRWLTPGIVFIQFLAKSSHLEMLSNDDYGILLKEIKTTLETAYGNSERQRCSMLKVRSSSVSSVPSQLSRTPNYTFTHRRVRSGGRAIELNSSKILSPSEKIQQDIANLELNIDKKYRERKQIGHIFNKATTISGTTPDPVGSLKSRNIDFRWRRGTRIGKGGAGIAFRAVNISNGSIVCMKEIELASIVARAGSASYSENLRRIAKEIDMIMTVDHPNIVRYFGIEKYRGTIYICMEYCLSTVNEFLNDIRAFQKRTRIKRASSVLSNDSSDPDEVGNAGGIRVNTFSDIDSVVRGFVKQLLDALMALHEMKIVHCDVKGDNIFIASQDGKYIVKLGDFNLSHRFELDPSPADIDLRSTQKGTIYFKPPESEYVYASDIWALGCTVIEMLTGKLPWTNVMRSTDDGIYIQNQLLAKRGPPIPDDIKTQTEAREFIELCLTVDCSQRPTARELQFHPYSRVLPAT